LFGDDAVNPGVPEPGESLFGLRAANHKRTVYVVDDDRAIRRSLSLFLATVGMQSRPYLNGADFLADVSHLPPGCVLLDFRMPDRDGLQVLEQLAERLPLFPTIVMTGHGDIDIAVRAMKLGATDFIEKPYAEDMLTGALDRVFRQLDEHIQAAGALAQEEDRLRALTGRETDVLRGLGMGMSNKGLAAHLALSVRTVEMHRANMMAKLGARNLSDVLRLAYRAGLMADGQ
jgi:two-component system response regulator FixJ